TEIFISKNGRAPSRVRPLVVVVFPSLELPSAGSRGPGPQPVLRKPPPTTPTRSIPPRCVLSFGPPRWTSLSRSASRHERRRPMNGRRPLSLLIIALIALVYVTPAAAQARADTSGSQMTWAVHVSLAPVWFDPAEHTGIITPMM